MGMRLGLELGLEGGAHPAQPLRHWLVRSVPHQAWLGIGLGVRVRGRGWG